MQDLIQMLEEYEIKNIVSIDDGWSTAGEIEKKIEKAGLDSNITVKDFCEAYEIEVDEEENELCHVTLQSPVDADIREEVFYALAEVRCAILEMNSKKPTLEEAFIRLTGKGGKQ